MVTAATASTIGRRAFVAGAAALAASTACSGGDESRPAASSAGRGRRHPLAQRGVNYDVGDDDGVRRTWRRDYVEREMTAIRDDLHANAVILLGSNLDRLMEAGAIAAERGLFVWFEPRQFDRPPDVTLDFLAEVAAGAERLRADHPRVGLSMGVELTLFLPGLVPGDDFMERGAALERPDAAGYNDRLNAFLAEARTTAAERFDGRLTYSSGLWEEVDWSAFDVVGVDMYRDRSNAATFARDVRRLHRHGKPVVITEFGCCTFRGAEDLGGEGFLVMDWTAPEPRIPEDLVRDEGVQARYIAELLDVFEAARVHGAFVWDFIEPESPWSPDQQQDFDMVSFAVARCHAPGTELAYDTTGHWEPKEAFRTLAERFA